MSSMESFSSFWDSTPIGRSIDLCLCKSDQLSPQLILEDKIFRLQNNLINHPQIQFIGTLISDDESQRLTYVIDRLVRTNDINNHQLLNGEFLIPIQSEKKNLIQDQIKKIDLYCCSSLPIELHRFFYLCGEISLCPSSSVNLNLSFDLLTIKNSFLLTPIKSNYIQIIPTALLKTLHSSIENNLYKTQPHFGYCSLDRRTKNQILVILESDPQACTLPLIGIWISGINDIQCSFVWSACIRYCFNSSLKQRLRTGINSQQSFLLACYSSTSSNQCHFYEVHSTSSRNIEYDLWTSSKQIFIPDLSSYQYNTQFPYDFQFKRVYNEPINDYHHQMTFLSPNKNGSLFGIPRSPPKQSSHQSPSWDLITTSPSPSTVVPNDTRWKEEFIERMQSYETHIQSLTALVNQLLTTQQTSISTPMKECTKHDVAVQSEPSSPCINQTDRHTSQSPIMTTHDRLLTSPVVHPQESIIDYSSLRRSNTPSIIPTDLNPVDILKPIFQFIDNQQQKHHQQQESLTTNNHNEEIDSQNENKFHLANVTSTTTTGISFISNGVQMQFINQQSSTTTVYPQTQPAAPPPPPPPSSIELVPISPQKSENNLSIEVHGLEMKYLEDDQLAVAIECGRQSQTPQIVDKSLSFGTQEYLKRYGLFNQSNSS